MVNLTPTMGPGSIDFGTQTAYLTCTDALSKGDIVMLTLASGGYSACTKSATADSTPDHLLGVALDDVAAAASGHIGLRGVFECACEADMDAGIPGSQSASTAGRLKSITTNPADDSIAFVKMVAISLEATATAGDLTSCLFDGIVGFAAQAV